MQFPIQSAKERAIRGERIGMKEVLDLCREGSRNLFSLMAAASEIREAFKGRAIQLCSITNAKSGRCPENCRFCAQSAFWQTSSPVYPLKSADEMIREASAAREAGALMFGIVTSGTRITRAKEWDAVFHAVDGIRALGIRPCASLGLLSVREALRLKDAGLYRYHHNLETARSYFPKICSTHDYEEDVSTVRAAREAGLSICSGGIIGLGEGMTERIEMALLLRELEVDCIPLNVLNPIPGTPLERAEALRPTEILLTISILRFLLPERDIRLCGGKEKSLRQLLPLGLIAGANALMTGDYLTTTGRNTILDMEMIHDLGLSVAVSAR
jgi:biotin synthase